MKVMVGYLNRPDETSKAFDEDGFLHTGDTAKYDEDGYTYIVLKSFISFLIHVKQNEVINTRFHPRSIVLKN
jgi:acyl-CoA synthetase (AMP-forming)/AMP-acid ligase II